MNKKKTTCSYERLNNILVFLLSSYLDILQGDYEQ